MRNAQSIFLSLLTLLFPAEKYHKLIFKPASGQICTNIFKRSLNITATPPIEFFDIFFKAIFFCSVFKEIQNYTLLMQFNNDDRCFQVELKNR